MKASVKTLRLKGRNLNRDELKDVPAFVGLLRIREERDRELNRTMVCAQLLDPTSTADQDLVPMLVDASLVWGEANKWRITGIERLDDADVAQTWSVEFN